MRTIKFRAWDKDLNRMLYSGSVTDSFSNNRKHGDELLVSVGGGVVLWNCNETYLRRTDEFVLMQFTGLLDKNGKPIFEGDILDWGDNFSSEVYWDAEEASFRIRELGIVERRFETVPRTHNMQAYTFKPTILGNVHEDLGLLKCN